MIKEKKSHLSTFNTFESCSKNEEASGLILGSMTLDNIHVPQTIKKAQVFSRDNSCLGSESLKPISYHVSIQTLEQCPSIIHNPSSKMVFSGVSLADLGLLNPNPKF